MHVMATDGQLTEVLKSESSVLWWPSGTLPGLNEAVRLQTWIDGLVVEEEETGSVMSSWRHSELRHDGFENAQQSERRFDNVEWHEGLEQDLMGCGLQGE